MVPEPELKVKEIVELFRVSSCPTVWEESLVEIEFSGSEFSGSQFSGSEFSGSEFSKSSGIIAGAITTASPKAAAPFKKSLRPTLFSALDPMMFALSGALRRRITEPDIEFTGSCPVEELLTLV
jgi:hypothetical protein